MTILAVTSLRLTLLKTRIFRLVSDRKLISQMVCVLSVLSEAEADKIAARTAMVIALGD